MSIDTTALQLRYKFDDGSGTTPQDSSGNARHGTMPFASPAWTTGKINGGLAFDRTFAQVVATPVVGTFAAVTFSWWTKITGLGGGFYTVYSSRLPAAVDGTIDLSFVNATDFNVYIEGSGFGYTDYGTAADFPLNTWMHLAYTYDSVTGAAKLYKNGVLLDSKTYTAGRTIVLGTGGVGDNPQGYSDTYNGIIDDFRIYSAAKTAGEVLAIYQDSAYVNEIAPNSTGKIIQRVGTTKAVTVSGGYRTELSTPASVEIQTYLYGTNTVSQAWTPITNATISGGTWTGTFLANNSPLVQHQARTKDSGGNVLETSLAANYKWGVGMLVACLGQSNMSLMFQTQDGTAGSPHADTLVHAVDPNNAGSYIWNSLASSDYKGNGGIVLARKLAQGSGVAVGLMFYSVGGTVISQWIDTTPGTPWAVFLLGLAAAGGDCEFVLWHQGENDEQISTPKNVYKASLTRLYDNLRALTGRSTSQLKFGCALLGNIDHSPGDDVSTQAIRQGQQEWIYEISGAFFAGSSVDMVRGDDFHWSAPYYERMALRYSQAILHQLGLVAFGADGSRITNGSVFLSTGFTVLLQYSPGAVLLDSSGSGAGTDITGFEASPDGFSTVWTPSATAYFNSNPPLILLRFAELLKDGDSIRYQYGENPVITNVTYDSTSPQGDTRGLPLQPRTAFVLGINTGNPAIYPGSNPNNNMLTGLSIYG